jgi:hypothetical protein
MKINQRDNTKSHVLVTAVNNTWANGSKYTEWKKYYIVNENDALSKSNENEVRYVSWRLYCSSQRLFYKLHWMKCFRKKMTYSLLRDNQSITSGQDSTVVNVLQ